MEHLPYTRSSFPLAFSFSFLSHQLDFVAAIVAFLSALFFVTRGVIYTVNEWKYYDLQYDLVYGHCACLIIKIVTTYLYLNVRVARNKTLMC